jgi:hypothetical protein
MKKVVLALTALLTMLTVSNAGMMDSVVSKATDVAKEKAEKKATEVATKQAEKSLTDGSLKEKAIKKATEVADEHTDGMASKAIDTVKSVTK